MCNYFQISYGEGEFTTYDFNFNAFCKTYNFNTHTTYNALQALDRTSVIHLSQQYQNTSVIMFLISSNHLFTYLKKHQDISMIVKSILRTYGGAFDQDVKINTAIIAKKLSLQDDDIIDTLVQLEKDNIISLKLNRTDAEITFLEPREDDKTINRITRIIEQQNKLKKQQVTAVIDYINNDTICKSVQLLSYFGEENAKNCGHWGKEIIQSYHLTLIPIEHVNPDCRPFARRKEMRPQSISCWRLYGTSFSTV